MAFTHNEEVISELFQAAFARSVSSTSALNAWASRYETKLNSGLSDDNAEVAILREMLSSTESSAIYGDKNDEEMVSFIFSNSLGRAPSDDGLAAWTARAAGLSLDELQYEILSSARNNLDNDFLTTRIRDADDLLNNHNDSGNDDNGNDNHNDSGNDDNGNDNHNDSGNDDNGNDNHNDSGNDSDPNHYIYNTPYEEISIVGSHETPIDTSFDII